jgi:pyruvate dehydrogenase E1 component
MSSQNKSPEKINLNTPYINSISPDQEPSYPGNQELEWRIRSIIRWNAMAMVVRANRLFDGLGGHISTFASAATLYEVGFHHFFKGPDHPDGADLIFFQGHASPGIYARAFLEGRLKKEDLENFRQESNKQGLSSYPHPWLMPNFWQFPTVSMGLGPLMAIYQARFIHYLEDRGLKEKSKTKVWAYLGDGETDEPESLGSLSLASREKLNNLIFVVNCNLQRLDGPVRGNGKIIQELERVFLGAGWNVIKVIWGRNWDELFQQDKKDKLKSRLGEIVDGQYQKYTVESGAYIRKHFVADNEDLKEIFKDLSDRDLKKLRRGGHDEEKVYAAYHQAVNSTDAPTVILAKTIKGYGLGEAGEGKNITHQQKKLNEEELREFRARFGIPILDEKLALTPFYKPANDSEEIKYLKNQREKLGGFLPFRKVDYPKLEIKDQEIWQEFYQGTKERAVSTTMVLVRILSKLLKDEGVGKNIVPIVPDEARTFGMEGLFKQYGIYAHQGQKYEPVDSESLVYYKEAIDGQILEEGITEAGGLSSFIAAGTSHINHSIPMIPFFIYYSMFGFQRVGDLIWAAGDMRCKGFLVGGTAGRTTLNGEGLQHQDGHSHLLASSVPNLKSYDPTFSFEMAVIIEDGIRRMYQDEEDIFYYLTVENENYPMPSREVDEKLKQSIIKGLYCFEKSTLSSDQSINLLANGAILNQAIQAKKILEEEYQVSTNIFSVTSFNELYREAMDCERYNQLHPMENKKSHLTKTLENHGDNFIVVSDYVKLLGHGLANWIPGDLKVLGTDGFGRSDTREKLRSHFEVDASYIVINALSMLVRKKEIDQKVFEQALKKYKINPEKTNPLYL